MKKPTQKDRVRSILLRDGEITNHQAIDMRLSTRLGAIIHSLRNEGMKIEGEFIEGTKNYRYYLPNRPRIKVTSYEPVYNERGFQISVRKVTRMV